MLVLDHVFCLVSPDMPEANVLREGGFAVSAGGRHPGQGTANRTVACGHNYLELLYIDDVAEARRNPLRLDRHADDEQPAFAPFGIGLCGTIEADERSSFWDYCPDYGPEGFRIPVHRSQQAGAPVVFVVPEPANKPLLDPLRPSGIQRVLVVGPGLSWPLAEQIDSVTFESAPSPHMTIWLGGLRSALEVNSRLTLRPTS